jgi:NAD(P)-dependent dehydrogenase (short-subunit alcohol dehydrogenase family)
MKIFITGSTTGLGELTAQGCLSRGHEVILHARDKTSNQNLKAPYVYGDLLKLEDVRSLAKQLEGFGPMDAVVHNAGIYTAPSEDLFRVNVLAPFVLSTLIERPKRMIFLSSGMHLGGELNLNHKSCTYSDTKLFDLMLAKWFARQWPESLCNAVDPGWVPTRMGGAGAPDDLNQGAATQIWLATSQDAAALVSGNYFHHLKSRPSNPIADSEEAQEELVATLKKLASAEEVRR